MKSQSFLLRGLLLALLSPGFANADVWSDIPDWGNMKRILKVHIRTGGAFKTAVQGAISTWNTANAGNNDWMFMEVANASDANVSIGQECLPGAGDLGLTTATSKSTGLFGWGAGKVNSMKVDISKTLAGNQQVHTILHELGHTLRLDHTNVAGDAMKQGLIAQTTVSANDVAMAKVSDVDPPCPLAASSNLVRGLLSTITLTPKPGSGIDLQTVTAISVAPGSGPDFTAEVNSWDEFGISVDFDASLTACHNSAFIVTLTHADDSEVQFTGVLTITDTIAPPRLLPHADAGPDATVTVGTPVLLDGTASFHDDPSVFISGAWIVLEEGVNVGDAQVLFSDRGAVNLPPGTYTGHLRIKDFFGRTSDDTTRIVVEGDCIPTVSEWGLIVMTLLLLTAGTVVFGRRRRRAVA